MASLGRADCLEDWAPPTALAKTGVIVHGKILQSDWLPFPGILLVNEFTNAVISLVNSSRKC